MKWEERIVDGFLFEEAGQMSEAQDDMQRIAQLEDKLNYDNLDAVAMVYIKSVQNELFHTVVGASYLKRLQLYLKQNGYQRIDFDKYPIPICDSPGETDGQDTQSGAEGDVQGSDSHKWRVRTKYQQELKQRLRTSIWLNVILAGAVIALFVITLKGENVNIINYRYNIENRYAEWQKQLEEREAAVREKEQALERNE